ncbi:MAG: LysE family translocator [Janthinobacterium lividum]
MLGITGFPLFVAAVFLLNITPGPDTAYIVGRSVAQGRGAGVVSALGISAGCIFHTLACAFGLTALLAASAAAFTVIKFAGAVYLIYLGARMLLKRADAPAAEGGLIDPSAKAPDQVRNQASNQAPRALGTDRVTQPAPPRTLRQLFTQGCITNVLNPKVVLFFVAFFPQFVATDSRHKMLAFLALGAVFVVSSTIWNVFVAWIAGTVTRRFSGKPAVKKWVDRGVGSAFIGLGLRLAALRH